MCLDHDAPITGRKYRRDNYFMIDTARFACGPAARAALRAVAH
jgi:hypothetical protein